MCLTSLRLVMAMLALTILLSSGARAEAPASPQAIWDYAVQIGLSTSQVETLKASAARATQESKALQSRRQKLLEEAAAMDAKSAPLSEIRAKLVKASEAEVDLRILSLRLARDVQATLTSEQMQKWRQIQASARPGAAVTSGTSQGAR